MKRYTYILLLSIIINFSCEKDDFCLQNPVTPKLVLRFYDNSNKQIIKRVKKLSIWAKNKDTILAYKSINKDSVAIPLNSLKNNTIYHLKMNDVDGNKTTNKIATFAITYTPKEEYVSRSCGFKVIFNNVSFSSDNSWIKGFTPQTLTTINNQNAAHVKVYH